MDRERHFSTASRLLRFRRSRFLRVLPEIFYHLFIIGKISSGLFLTSKSFLLLDSLTRDSIILITFVKEYSSLLFLANHAMQMEVDILERKFQDEIGSKWNHIRFGLNSKILFNFNEKKKCKFL